jgi:hypothetical protein
MDSVKDIKDFIHLYLGQQVRVRKKNDSDREYLVGRICEVTRASNHGDWVKVWFDDDLPTVTDSTWHQSTSNCHFFFMNEDEIQIILRRLSSMTEEERSELWSLVFGTKRSKFRGNTVWFPEETISSDPRWVLMQGVERFGIEMNGTVWADSDLHAFKHNQHEVTRYLLSKGFDLFGLIESGLAIDKETIKP